MSRPNIEVAFKGDILLGEGPHWVEERQDLLYVDIPGQTVHRYVPSTGRDYKLKMDGRTTFIVPVESKPNTYIIGLERSMCELVWDGVSTDVFELNKLNTVEENYPKNRFNDGKCDPQGRLWAGTMGYETDPGKVDPEKGHLYKLDRHGRLTSHVDKIGISNGLAWSADSSKFFYIDSVTFTVDVFDFNSSEGLPSNRRVLFDLKKNNISGLADGMAIDTDNNIWVALHAGGKILHIDTTTGTLLDTIDFANRSSMLTSVAFGGPNLDELYVTSANYRLSPEQQGIESDPGALFKITNIGAKGAGGGINYRM